MEPIQEDVDLLHFRVNLAATRNFSKIAIADKNVSLVGEVFGVKTGLSGTDLNNCGKNTDVRSPPVDSWSRDFNLKIFNCSKSKLKTRIHQIFLLIHLIYLDDLIRLIQLVHGLKDLNKICLGGWGLADSPGDLDTHDLDWN